MTHTVLKKIPTAVILSALFALPACQTTAPAPQQQEVVIVPEVVETCTPISALQTVVIPAETKVFYAITEIANPPYEPIQRKEKQVREIKPAETIYVDSQGKQVLDICDKPIG